MIDTPTLSAFMAVAETGSFSAAAERLYITQPAISKRIALLEQQLGAGGDFARYYVLAHEYGHHIQTITGISQQIRSAQQQNPSRRNQLQVLMELQADCYAGVWAGKNRNLIEPGDIEESMNAAAAIGDPSVAIGPLAAVTAGYSGADLAGLVRSAASFALERYIGRDRLVGAQPAEIFADGSAGESELEVRLDDLVSALREVAPGAHGARRAAPLGKAGAGRRGVRERLRLARQTSRLRAMCRGSE